MEEKHLLPVLIFVYYCEKNTVAYHADLIWELCAELVM